MVFLEQLSLWIISIIQAHGSLAVFLGIIIEEVIIPIPSSVVLMSAGFILIDPSLPLFQALWQIFIVIAIPASIAATIGSFFPYAIGYFAGEPLLKRLLKRYHRFFGMSWKDLKNYEKKVQKKKSIWYYVILLRASVIAPMSVVSLTVGFLRLSWKKFALATFIGAIPRAMILGFLGWTAGKTYTELAGSVGFLETIALMSLVLIGLFFLAVRIKMRKSKKKR